MENTENHAIRVLEEGKQQAEERFRREIAEIDMAIARLRIEDSNKGGHLESKTKIEANQFRGLSIANALVAYLNLMDGRPVRLDDVVRDLLIAGVDMGNATGASAR